ncbi:ferrous iron transport protein A [Chitinibacter bivalviorum]|uniref:Ferrous iron transport protein A n=1 Tax=Chitinibacter bivalviorum TaxID=2739434 RepID=A0A7H9BJC3_9NEIS|nr:FeoA family protein [Chitinibacter bivalviorum]QLG88750.1 ferrous iron transport protein A [Chitinibacter bivalviorum]
MNLAQIPLTQAAQVIALDLPADLSQRLSALGLRINSEVKVLRRGWLGGPLQLRVGGTEIMLRRDAAQGIKVRLISSEMPSACSAEVVA